jgi:CubicO group peptidase (beta-lactamase class C family)
MGKTCKLFLSNPSIERLFIPLALCLWYLAPSATHAQHSSPSELDAYILTSMNDWEIPGLAVAITKGDSVRVSKGYGVREVGKSHAVDDRTMFAIASLSKAFTSASLAILAEQGKVRWDDKVTEHLPYFQLHDPYSTREMTVRDLLCHRSGLHTYSGDLIWYGTSYNRQEVVRRIRHLQPRHSFRATYGYQNIMFIAAGEIILAVTGRIWDEFVKDSIFVPLGMTRTNTSVTMLARDANVATPHTHRDGMLITIPYRNVDNIGSAGSINSCAADIARWMRMLLRDDSVSTAGRLSASARHELWSPVTAIPLSQSSMRMYPGRHFYAAGLGWFVMDYKGRRVLTHGGGMDGMISRIALVPEEKLGIVILTNSINGLPLALMYRILDMYLGGETRDWSGEALARRENERRREHETRMRAERERAKGTSPSLSLSGYGGIYRSDMYGDVKVEVEKDKLVVRFLPTASFVGDLSHWHYDTFTIELRDPTLPPGMVTFVLDANGRSSEIRVDIPNPDFDFSELKLERVH